jgi:hypothetical protein
VFILKLLSLAREAREVEGRRGSAKVGNRREEGNEDFAPVPDSPNCLPALPLHPERRIRTIEEALAGNLSESDDSDQDLEDIVALKYRARTPPWQRVEQSQW